jgi:predicted aspartyl protease
VHVNPQARAVPYRIRRQRPTATILLACAACICLAALAGCSIQVGTFASTPTPTATGPGISIQVHVEHSQDGSTLILVPVTINNQGPFTFALDTGASTSLIDQPLARRLGLRPAGSPVPIAGISSNEQAVPVQVSHWHAGKLNLPSQIIASASLYQLQRGAGLQGLLGSDIWNQFGKITIDYAAGTLTVSRQIADTSISTVTDARGSRLQAVGVAS